MKKIKFSQILGFQKKSHIKASDGLSEGTFPLFTSSPILSKYINTSQFDSPSLIFGTGGSASVHICEKPFSVSTDCLVAQLKPIAVKRFEIKFIYYYLSGNISILQKGFKGIGLKHISKGYISDIDIPELELEDQKRIVKILDEADALRQKRKQAIGLLNDYLKSVFLEMFGDPITNSKNWNLVKFTDVLVLRRGFDLPKQNRTIGSYPLVASNGIVDRISEFKVEGPGIVTGRSGTLGSVQLIEEDYWPLNTSLYSQKLNSNNPVYLKFFLENFDLKRFTRGAGVPTLNRNLFHSEMIPKVPIELQNKFANVYRKNQSIKQKMTDQSAELETQFQALMQKAFKGEL